MAARDRPRSTERDSSPPAILPSRTTDVDDAAHEPEPLRPSRRSLREYIFPALPPVSGSHRVGVIDLEIPAREPRSFGGLLLHDKTPALQLDTVLMSVFYPTTPDANGPRMPWFGRPMLDTASGYAKFGSLQGVKRFLLRPIMALIGGLTRVPAVFNAPIASDVSPKPLVLFSHGLGGSRTTYARYCTELASRGYVVASVEHRDGSGPSTWVNPLKGEPRHILYLSDQDILESTRKPRLEMRTAELDMRVQELLEALHVMRRIRSGDGAAVARENVRVAGAKGFAGPSSSRVDWAAWSDRFTLADGAIAAGHSFGGGTVLHALQTVDPSLVRSAILLDPWLEPVPEGDKAVTKPILCLNNPGFTVWRPHFKRLRGIIASAVGPSWLATIGGTVHMSFSDFGLLFPRALRWTSKCTIDPKHALELIVDASIEFLDNEPGPILSTPAERAVADDMTEPGKIYMHEARPHRQSKL